jgi:DNA-binding response OmpR family regulator
MILDLMLPDTHGLVLCANLKAKVRAPIILCSATKRHEDAALGFKLGADDFIAKPFSIDELLARMEKAMRGDSPPTREPAPGEPSSSQGSWCVGELVIDEARCEVTLGGEVLRLTPTEYRLLCALASCADTVISRKELGERIWGYYDPDVGRTLDVHVRRLRAKLDGGTVASPRLVTQRGFGYRLVREPEPDGAASRCVR